MIRRLLVLPALAAAGVAVGCQPTPPPPAKVCTPITEEQNNAVTQGMDVQQVQVAIGIKPLTLSDRMEFANGDGTTTLYESYEWKQSTDTNGCYQYVIYQFKNGALTSKLWSKVVK